MTFTNTTNAQTQQPHTPIQVSDWQPATKIEPNKSQLRTPMTRRIRSELAKDQSLLIRQTSGEFEIETPTHQFSQPRATRGSSRTISNMRAKLQQEKNNAQTLDQLLEEMDREPARARTPLQDRQPNIPGRADPNGLIEGLTIPNDPSTMPTVEPQPMGAGNPTTGQVYNQPAFEQPIPEIEQPYALAPMSDLENFERLALENHPVLNAAIAQILAARHEAVQAGLRPNPSLGLFIDEAGNENNPGIWGAYIQRNVIRGNKLGLGREIKNRKANKLEVDFETMVMRIRTDVRTSFYKLLIVREKQALALELFNAQQEAISKSKQLFEAGETPKTDLLQTELQAERTKILLSQIEVKVKNAWREFATVVGNPQLEFRQVTGQLDPMIAQVSFEEYLAHIISNSPELQSAQAEVERVRTTIDREFAETIPNYQTQLTLGRDSTTNHFFTGVQVQVPLQIYNQNQGNISAAKSRLVVARNNVERIKLNLSKRLSAEYNLYQSALVKAEAYRTRLIPAAQESLGLLTQGYPEEVSFLRLSTAQQSIIDITLDYLDTISVVWESRLKIEGLLLNNSLSQ